MRRYIWLILCSFLVHTLWAVDFDRENILAFDIQGTARYVGMAGAMTALGGDVSAVKDNPAGLGVFRRNELSLTIDYMFDKAVSRSIDYPASRFGMPQLSWVISFGDPNKLKGTVFNNFMFSYHRVGQYHRNLTVGATFSSSQTDLMASLTNGLIADGLQADNSWSAVWDDPDVGWLSVLGYNTGLIVPVDNGSDQWTSILSRGEKADAALSLTETGLSDEYSIAYANNISNRLYLGLAFNLRTLSYSKTAVYSEQFQQGGDYQLISDMQMNGIGFNANIGAIYRPVDMLRIGASWQIPTFMTVNFSDYASVESTLTYVAEDVVDTRTVALSTPVNSYTSEQYQLPMRTTFGVAYQFLNSGLLSVEYDYLHHFQHAVSDRHFFKIGGEYVWRNWFFRLGYAFQSSFLTYETEPLFAIGNTNTRTDTDFRNIFRSHYVGAGFGYRNRWLVLDLAYQYRHQTASQYASSLHADQPFHINPQTHRLVLTFSWSTRWSR